MKHKNLNLRYIFSRKYCSASEKIKLDSLTSYWYSLFSKKIWFNQKLRKAHQSQRHFRFCQWVLNPFFSRVATFSWVPRFFNPPRANFMVCEKCLRFLSGICMQRKLFEKIYELQALTNRLTYC